MRECEGIRCNSPKSCFREALAAGLVTEEQAVTCLEMTDDRNLTSHTYIEEVAERIYKRVEDYRKLMEAIFGLARAKLQGER